MKTLFAAMTGLLALFLIACGDQSADNKAQTAKSNEAEEPHIAWFDGSVEEAFAKAKAENKPVLLYWGAVWCPPCNQLKVTIFKRPDFIKKTDEFVAVYLDGDTDRAQRYGEEFKGAGYPTLIVLDADRNEVTRIPGGMNLEAYVTVLDLALARTQPAARLLKEVLDDGRDATPDELKLLAHYSWGQDRGKALGERNKLQVFKSLADLTPDGLVEEKSRFTSDYLYELAASEEDLPNAVKDDAFARATWVFSDPVRTRADPYLIDIRGARLIKAITGEDSQEQADLIALAKQSLADLAADETLSPAEQLYVHFGEVRLEELETGEISQATKDRVRASVDRHVAEAVTEYERSTVINVSVGVLFETDQNDHAGDIMKAEIENSSNAYYWMVDLADLAEEAEQTEEAVALLKKAFDTAEGQATRIQWGSYYVDGLTRMTSDDGLGIQSAASAVLTELAAQQDPVYHRNKGAVKRIARALNKWAHGDGEEDSEGATEIDRTGRPEIFAVVTEQFDSICNEHFETGDELDACLKLFRPQEAQG